MIYKFIEQETGSNYFEIEKHFKECHLRATNVHNDNYVEIFLTYQQIYDLIGALNEIKKRIEREGDK